MAGFIFPFTNLHELNLDWVVQIVKELSAKWDQVEKDWQTEQEEFDALKKFVTDYFEKLDVQTEINNKIADMAETGQLASIFASIIGENAGPVFVDSTAEMLDHDKLYALKSSGAIYQWDGSAFSATGFVYGTGQNVVSSVNMQYTADNYTTLGWTDIIEQPRNTIMTFAGSITEEMIKNLPSYGNSIVTIKFTPISTEQALSCYLAFNYQGGRYNIWSGYLTGTSVSAGNIDWILLNPDEYSLEGGVYSSTLTPPFSDIVSAPGGKCYGFTSSITEDIVKNLPRYGIPMVVLKTKSRDSVGFTLYIAAGTGSGTGPTWIGNQKLDDSGIEWYIMNEYNPIGGAFSASTITLLGWTNVINMPAAVTFSFSTTVTEDMVTGLPVYGKAQIVTRLQSRDAGGYDLFIDAVVSAGGDPSEFYFGTIVSGTAIDWYPLSIEYPGEKLPSLFRTFAKFGVIGDSMARGSTYPNAPSTGGVIRQERLSWPEILADNLGTTVYNFSAGGMDMQEFIDGYTEGGSDPLTQSIDTMLDGSKPCPCYIFALGINQTYGGSIDEVAPGPAGEKPVNGSFYECAGYIINRIFEKYNDDVFVFILNLPYYPTFSEGSIENRNNAFSQIVAKYQEAGYNVYLADFAKYRKYFDTTGVLYPCWRANHLTGVGYEAAADLIQDSLNRAIADAPANFWKADFLETNT